MLCVKVVVLRQPLDDLQSSQLSGLISEGEVGGGGGVEKEKGKGSSSTGE